jgi:hypothetical protein
MPSYLVETFLSGVGALDRDVRERATGAAAAASTRGGTPVHVRGSVYVPEDEIWLLTVEAPSVADVERVAERAGLHLLRVVEAIPSAAVRQGHGAGHGSTRFPVRAKR